MNTNKVYYGVLRVSSGIKKEGSYFLDGVTTTTESDVLKPVLVLLKKSITGKVFFKDLNTGEKYMTKVPLKKGELFVRVDQLVSFKYSENILYSNLSKKQILEIGNKGLEAIGRNWIEKSERDAKQKVK